MVRHSRRFVRTVVASCLVGAMAVAAGTGCSSKPEIVPSTGQRAPSAVGAVKVYDKQPKKYEILGTVTVSREEGAMWDDRGDANKGFDTLISKAARLGANGLLLQVADGEFDRRATAGFHGKFYQVPVKGKPGVALAQAIYVHEE